MTSLSKQEGGVTLALLSSRTEALLVAIRCARDHYTLLRSRVTALVTGQQEGLRFPLSGPGEGLIFTFVSFRMLIDRHGGQILDCFQIHFR